MDIRKANSVLNQAISSFQESEFESIFEAGYKPPYPSKFGFGARKKEPEMSDEQRQDFIYMLRLYIETLKAKGEPVPRRYIQKLKKLELGGKKKSKIDWVYSDDEVFGHPSATTLAGYQHLIPVKVKFGDMRAVDKFIDRAQKKVDKLQTEIGKVNAMSKGTAAQKKAAKKKMQNANFKRKQSILSLLRDETMKELQSLAKAVQGRK